MKLRTAIERIREIEDKCVLYNIEKFVSKIFREKTKKQEKNGLLRHIYLFFERPFADQPSNRSMV